MKNVLVTGGAGYIGSHTCKALARAGFAPVVFDNLVHGHAHNVQWGPLYEGDIRKKDDILKALQHYNPVAVVHFAGLINVGESSQKPDEYYATNVTGTQNLVDAMQECGMDNLVFSSSCAVYGEPDIVPIGEDTAKNPINVYGETKLAGENSIQQSNLQYIIYRYFNACGADPEGQLGEEHDPETHLIPNLLKAARDNTAFQLYGDDYNTPDGTCIRDYIHVHDLATAHVLAVQKLLSGQDSGAYNLGTGHGYSVREIIEGAKRVTGEDIIVEIKDRRIGDPPRLVAQGDALKALGFVPQYMELDVIIKTAWAFMQ